ncbi:zinc finger protein 638-like [Solea senegalensis]|uniref:Zinc finger protein 638-like n=1 Tax=Solea senegalensis TaxID=28829 RepID=A0AAV6QSQ6_SOLSE|nr:zinc finger protein 638-like [Solea senegalensis]
MMHDYAAASPKVFPHTCSLCFTECRNIQDWISHQNTNLHLESCRYLRTLYSQWNGEIVLESSAAGKDAKSSTSAKNSQKSQRKSSHGSRSHSRSRSRSWSRSRSPSSRRRRRSEGRRENRSRSRSRSSRYSRSRSRSPYYDRRRSRSRSHERRRRSSERRSSEERRSSLRRTRDIRSSPRSRDRRSSPRSEERWSSSGRSEERRSSPKRSRERRLSPRRRDDRWSSPRSDDKRSSPKRSNERRSSTERSPQLKRSSSAEKLVKKLLEKTAKQSLSKESDLEAVVKTLLAEITKKKPSSSSSSMSAKRKQPKSSTSAGAKSSASAASSSSLSSSSAPKKEATRSTTTTTTTTPKTSLQKRKLAKASPQISTMVKLEGIVSSLSHGDIVAAVERFGKTKSVVLFRKQAKAHVFFEKCNDANKLKSAKIIDVSGISLTAGTLSFTKKDRQKASPLKKRGKLSASKPQTTKSPKSTIAALLSIPALLPTPGFRPSPGLLTTPGFPPSPGKCLKKKTLKGSVKGSTSVTKAKVLVFKAKNISKSPEHVSKRKKPVMQRKQPAAVDESANMSQIRVPETITELKVKVETASTSQEAETPVEKFIFKEEVEETSKSQESIKIESNVHPSVATPEDLVQVEMGKVAVSSAQVKHQAEPAKANVEAEDAQDAEPMEAEGKEAEVLEPMEVEPCAAGNGEDTENQGAAPEPQTGIETPETSVKTSSQTSVPEASQPSSLAEGSEKTDSTSLVEFQKDPESAEVSSKVTGGDPTESPAVATSDKMAPETAAVSKQPAAATPNLTIGETFEANFNKEKLGFLSMKSIMSPKFCQRPAKLMLITNLPKYNDGSYTEEDVAKLLIPFGFVYDDENIYVATQACVAFFVMPSPQSVRCLMRFTSKKRITLGNSELDISVTNCDFSMIPLQFYKFSMRRMKVTYSLPDDATRIVYVKNISPSEVKVLKEDLRKIDQVKNIFPLLNKVFVEFETSSDADRLGVWYSLLKDAPGYRIYRLEIPKSTTTAPLPRFPLKAIPHGNTAAVPSLKYGVPLNSVPPFWVTIPTRPFVFPTLSAWFIIPKFLTVRTKEEVSKANNQFFRTPTIMFTGLPQGHYKHEDVARLVWSYFPKQTLQSLYYRVSVLTLQRRAFVRFNDWVTCCKFVRDHIAKPICVRGFRLKIHFIFENVLMESTEELMYRSLMKLSNSRVPDREALEERLLCVEISEASVNIVTVVLEVVASIAPFISFLPLANRICVEMVDASGVAEVVEKYRSFSPDSQIRRTTWEKVLRFENMKSLKQRLEDANDVTVILEPEAPVGGAQAKEDAHKLGAETAVAESPTASKIDQDIVTANKAAIHQHKTSRGSRTNSEEKDVRDDFRSSDTYLSEVETFNMDDFVTVDEVGNDVQDTDPDQYRCSSSKRSHMAERGQQRSSYESARRMSTRSTRSSKTSSSSSSYKPREVSTKRSLASHSTSMSPKKAKRSPEPMKSQTKPSSSSSLRSPDSSSSSDPKTKSLVKATSASSSSCWIRPSSAAREREKDSASTAQPNPPESQSAVSQSDHRVSAEDTAAKTVESETKTETLSEMHTPAQGQGSVLSQIQNLEISFKDNKVADLEEGKDDLQKDTKEDEDDDENYQVLDSFEEQPENQVDDDDPQPEPESFQVETFQVLDSIEDDGEPSYEKCSEKELDGGVLVKDDSGSAVKQLSEVDVNRVSNKSEEKPASEDINNENRDKKDKNRSEEEEEASKEADKPDDQIPNDEDQLCEDKDDVKELDGKIANQEPFQILDLTEDQVAMEDHGQNLEPRSYQMSEDVIVLKEDGEEDETYQVVDSIEDQATTTTTTTESEADNKKKRTNKVETRSPRRSGRRTRATIDEEKEASSRQRDKALKEPETQTNKGTSAREDRETHEVNEVYEVIDSVEDEPVQGASISERSSRRRSARGKKGDLLETSKKPDGDAEAMYEILDSVEDDNVTEEQTVVTRSTRGRRERTTNKDAFIDLTDREDTPSRRRRTPARETPKKDVEPQEEGTPTKKSDVTVREVGEEEVTYEIVDSVEDEVVKDKRPTGRGRGRRGRPKKDMNMTKKGMGRQKKGDKEEKVSYQVLDSVEDETVDDHHPPAEHSKSARGTGTSESDETLKEESAGLPKKEEEEEPVYQIVDSVEDDQVQEELMMNKTSDEISSKVEEPTVEEETSYSTSVVEASEDVVYGLEEISDASSAEDDFGFENMEGTKVNSKEGSQQGTEMPAEEKNDIRNFLVNLDEVSDEEEDYPDDTAEEEELRKTRAAAEERRFAKEQESQQEKRRTREKEEGRRSREREQRSSSRGGGGSSEERRRRVKESRRDKDVEELVTLDEVGADEAGEEAAAAQNLEWGGEVTTGELQELVTLDEVLEDEEEEEAKAEERSQEESPLSKVDESVDSLNIKTLDEAGVHQEAKVEELQRTESVKRKHGTVDESVNFVTVDEVGGVEEEEEKEAPRTRGRPKKKTRKTPVRKSARGKKVATDEQGEEEKPSSDEPPPPPDPLHASSSPDKDLTTFQSEGRHKIQKTEEEGAGEAGADAPSAGQELPSENQSLEGSVEEEEKTPEGSVDIKAVSKRRRELVGPEAKRSRSQSPCVPIDVKLPPFNPDDSYGREFVIPKLGYFCNLCRVFYVNESDTRDVHCSSRTHYDNLQNHLQELQNKPSRSSAQNSQGSISELAIKPEVGGVDPTLASCSIVHVPDEDFAEFAPKVTETTRKGLNRASFYGGLAQSLLLTELNTTSLGFASPLSLLTFKP